MQLVRSIYSSTVRRRIFSRTLGSSKVAISNRVPPFSMIISRVSPPPRPPPASLRTTAGLATLRHKHLRRDAADLGGDSLPRRVHAHTRRPHLCGDNGMFHAPTPYAYPC